MKQNQTNVQDMFLSDKKTRTNLLRIIYSLKRRHTQVKMYKCMTCIYVPDTDLSIITYFFLIDMLEQRKWYELLQHDQYRELYRCFY